MIKTALALKHKTIPAQLNFKEANPKINFAESPFYITTETKKLEKGATPLRALVNSFGVGGTNACVVLEEAEEIVKVETKEEVKTLVLSAKSEEALDQTKTRLHEFVLNQKELNLTDLAYTYQVGRRAFKQRGFLTYRNRADLLTKLATNSLSLIHI